MNDPSDSLYGRIRRMAADRLRQDPARRSICATDLAHDAYLRLLPSDEAEGLTRGEFLGRVARTLRRLLVERARRRNSDKRGEGRAPVQLDLNHEDSSGLGMFDVLVVHEALDALEAVDSRQAKIVEMRFFGGFTTVEIAEALECSERTVRGNWRLACAWLADRIDGGLNG